MLLANKAVGVVFGTKPYTLYCQFMRGETSCGQFPRTVLAELSDLGIALDVRDLRLVGIGRRETRIPRLDFRLRKLSRKEKQERGRKGRRTAQQSYIQIMCTRCCRGEPVMQFSRSPPGIFTVCLLSSSKLNTILPFALIHICFAPTICASSHQMPASGTPLAGCPLQTSPIHQTLPWSSVFP